MNRFSVTSSALLVFSITQISLSFADEPVTLENVSAPLENNINERIADQFSVEKAIHFLDSASLNWQKTRRCMTCHTNYAYLYARPSLSRNPQAHQTVREFAEKLVTDRWKEKGPRWDAEVVATAAALAFNDSATTGNLHPTTRKALDSMWNLQREDGGWTWLNCNWPPMESDDHYGVTLAAIAVGYAPDDYIQTESAQNGLHGIRKFFRNNPPESLHQQAMLIWAGSRVSGILTEKEKAATVKELLSLQHEDGGWGLATLGKWKRSDDLEQDLSTSDGYGTGFALYILRTAGIPKESEQLQRGVKWLKENQRESGRWFTRSLNRDNKHYISHAGSAMAILGLDACSALDTKEVRISQSSRK